MALGVALASACGGGTVPPATPAPPPASRPSEPPAPPEPPPAVREVGLGYSAPPECPDREEYLAHVRARATRLRLAPDADAPPGAERVTVSVAADAAAGWLGEVSIAGELALDREVRGERCEDVVAALALITVLRLEGAEAGAAALQAVGSGAATREADGAGARGTDGAATREADGAAAREADAVGGAESGSAARASVGPEAAPAGAERSDAAGADSTEAERAEQAGAPGEPPEAQPAPPAAAAADGAVPGEPEDIEPTPDEPAEESEPPPAREAAPSPVGDPAPPRESAEPPNAAPVRAAPRAAGVLERTASAPLETSVGARFGYASVPEHALRGGLGAELRWGRTVASWASGLSLAFAGSGERTAPADLGFALLTAELELCAPGLGSESVWLRACGGLRAGALRLAVRPRVPEMERGSVVRPWISADPSLQLGVRLGGPWSLRSQFELAVQLVRDRFEVLRIEEARRVRFTVYRPPAVSLEAGLGLSYSF